jgi:hypothetical protein
MHLLSTSPVFQKKIYNQYKRVAPIRSSELFD